MRLSTVLSLLGVAACTKHADDTGDTDAAPTQCGPRAAASIGDKFFPTIQRALDVVRDGQIVEICSGVHRETLVVSWRDEGLPKGSAVTLRGAPDGTTVLDADGLGSVVNVNALSVEMSFLALTGGVGTKEGGGDSPIVSYGGGIVSVDSALAIDHVQMHHNRADFGGAMVITGLGVGSPASATLENCDIFANNGLEEPDDNAAVVLAGDAYHLTATKTGWGEGDDDNAPRDVILTTAGADLPYDVPEGADVTCDSVSESCTFE
jgi:hypothetical protein